MIDPNAVTPDDIIAFWFPDGANPDAQTHMDLWAWRMRGGANKAIMERYAHVTERAAARAYDHWADAPLGRLALIILLAQFPRAVWEGTPKAYAQDPQALALCLEGLEKGHFEALENVWFKTMFKLPMEHCECDDHLANLDRVIAIADRLLEEGPDHLKPVYEFAAGQPRKHREVIARFARHSHRRQYSGAYAANWSRETQEASASAYVPLSFDPGEAYQFDWSHEVVLMAALKTKPVILRPTILQRSFSLGGLFGAL